MVNRAFLRYCLCNSFYSLYPFKAILQEEKFKNLLTNCGNHDIIPLESKRKEVLEHEYQ
jgi:hypothetical protein